MTSCPACGESRWVYPRRHALGPLAASLAGWQPCKCRACGWRGWCRSARAGAAAERWSEARAGAAAASRLVQERAATILRVARPGFAAGLIASIALAIVLVGVRFSREKQADVPLESAPAVVRVLPPSSASELVEPGSERPPVVHAAEEVPVALEGDAISVTLSPRPDAARPRPSSGIGPAARRPNVAAPSPGSNPTPYRGSLAITSDPSGALVMVDGEVVGTAPVVLKDVRAGSRVVRIQSSGYETWSTAARVVANKETRVSATLQRRSHP